LVKEIIDKGFSHEDFEKFFLAKQGHGNYLNIDEWSQEQLKQVVVEFQ